MSPDEFRSRCAARLQADGARVEDVALPGGRALVGYQSRFRLRWAATKLNLFTVVATAPVVTAAALQDFTGQALDHAAAAKGRLRGLQTGVAAIAILAGDAVQPDAAGFAEQEMVRRFAAFGWPVAVDLRSGGSWSHQGRVVVGGLYAGWMRERIGAVLSDR
jgi:hypothetical protein